MTRASRPAHLVGVLVVLAGLFAMHGLSSAEVGSCHADGAMAAVPMMSVVSAMPATPAAPSALGPQAGAPRSLTGGSCLFVAPTGWAPLVLVLLAVLTATALGAAAQPRRTRRCCGRSPPDAEVSLRHRVSVSLT